MAAAHHNDQQHEPLPSGEPCCVAGIAVIGCRRQQRDPKQTRATPAPSTATMAAFLILQHAPPPGRVSAPSQLVLRTAPVAGWVHGYMLGAGWIWLAEGLYLAPSGSLSPAGLRHHSLSMQQGWGCSMVGLPFSAAWLQQLLFCCCWPQPHGTGMDQRMQL